MTAHKNFKQLIRSRMAKTGESYTTARRQVIRGASVRHIEGPARWHLPGSIPATTALRIVLNAAGVPPLNEELLFVLCGGIGAGMTAFYYEKADISTFFLGGRHLWHSDSEYITGALARFGIKPTVRESSGAKASGKHLQDALAGGRPCIAWVDMTHLPHRAMPSQFSGGGYHVITIYEIDEARGVALIGDLGDEPVEIKLEDLAVARARIKQFKNRLLTIPPYEGKLDLSKLISGGLKACHEGLKSGRGKGPLAMSGLGVFQKWAKQLGADDGKESWAEMFPRGHRLWTALSFAHDFIEHAHTGGGLCRPIFADGLAEAGLNDLSRQYAEIGRKWSDLAVTALPQDRAAFSQLKEFCSRRAELRAAGDAESAAELPEVGKRLFELRDKTRSDFPLSEAECAELRATLHRKVADLCDAELAAHLAMAKAIG